MNLAEIKDAVRAGKKVNWKSSAYEVRLGDGFLQEHWLIVCTLNNSAIGLTWTDGTTLNGKPEDFYIPLPNEGGILAGREVKYRDDRFVIVSPDFPGNWPQYADLYRVVDLETGHESAIYSMGECRSLITLAKRYELKGSFGTDPQVCNQLQNGGAHGN